MPPRPARPVAQPPVGAEHQLALLNEVARIATADLELRPMLQRITDLLHERCGWEVVACVSLDIEQQQVVCEALSASVTVPLAVGHTGPLGSGIVGTVAQSGEPRHATDVREAPTYLGLVPGTLSELCVPIKHRGRVVALLNLESPRLGAFDGQLAFVETVAEQISGNIANARIHAELRQRAAFTEVMAEVSRVALEPAPLDALLRRIVDYIAEAFAMPVASIILLDDDGARFVREVHGGSAAIPLPNPSWSIAEGIAGRSVRLGRPVLVTDVAQDPDYIEAGLGVRSEFVVPISYRERVLGVLNLESTQVDGFPTFAQRAFVGIADQIAGAIYGARLREQQREHAALMELLSDVSRFATRDAPLQDNLRDVSEYLAREFEVAVASVLLLDESGQNFVIETMAGEVRLGSPTGGEWPITVGVCGRAARSGVPQLAYAGEDRDYVPGHPQIAAEYVTPIKVGMRVLGVLNLESFHRHTFSESVCLVLDAVADQIAGAVNMALLNRRLTETNRMVEQRTTELAAVNQKLAQVNLELRRLSLHDPLTDIANRRRFDEVLRHEWRWGARTGRPLAVLLVDLDHFKPLNDTHGHPYGDECLRKVGRAMSGALVRAADFVARYGGEEFALVLPDTDRAAALAVAEALRAAVAALAIRNDGAPNGRLTLSVGVAIAVPRLEDRASELVEMADAALYAAKNGGRDQVQVTG
jgi:diguanylate cyclase (GGDEF)-like protein